MTESSDASFQIYRDGARRVSASELVRTFHASLVELSGHSPRDQVVSALLRAGEFECALCDAGRVEGQLAAAVTDALAAWVVGGRPDRGFADLARLAAGLLQPAGDIEFTVSRPEGFAYYALHPLDFADLVERVALPSGAALVVGIRSIGTTLSAVVAAALKQAGIVAERTTVRPTGHPYERNTRFNSGQERQVLHASSQNAEFIVCDEGPGRSGSSLLSVAEALEQQGVARERITILCSHQPNVHDLCAPEGPARWRRYKSVAAGLSRRIPSQAGEYLGGGEWRRVLLPQDEPWPAAWPQMERLKYLGRDALTLWRFQGHGHYGERVAWREQALSDSGYGVPYLGRDSGFGAHQLLNQAHPPSHPVTPELLRHLAEYCAWRAKTFACTIDAGEAGSVQEMTQTNLEREFGCAPELQFEMARPAICDARMHPSKWFRAREGWLKLDGSTHGDDHFLPGPTDIAWDLAGVCLEWELLGEGRSYFLHQYARNSGDAAASRLGDYELAYAAFRMAWSKMAAVSVRGSDDEWRLRESYRRYRERIENLLSLRQQYRSSHAA